MSRQPAGRPENPQDVHSLLVPCLPNREWKALLDDMSVDRKDAEFDGVSAGWERFDANGKLFGIFGRYLSVAGIDALALEIMHRNGRILRLQTFVEPKLNLSRRIKKRCAARRHGFHKISVGERNGRSEQQEINKWQSSFHRLPLSS